MLTYFRNLLAALRGGVIALQGIADWCAKNSNDATSTRLDGLERSRAIWEGEMEGQLVKLTAKFNAARSSEERTKKLVAELPEVDDDESPSGPEIPPELAEAYRTHVASLQGQPVRALPEVLANGDGDRGELPAKAKKWGR